MSNNLKFDFDKPLGDLNNSREPENLVIQCQFCETRYSIPSDSITNSTCPKFHCFSCDNIFEVNLNAVAATAPAPIERVPVEQAGFNFSLPVNSQQRSVPQMSFQKPAPVSSFQQEMPAPEPVIVPQPKASFGFSSTLKVTSEAPLATVRSRKEESRVSEKMNFAISNKAPDLSVRNIDTGAPRKSFVFTEFQKSISGNAEPVQQETASHSWKLENKLAGMQMPNVSVKDVFAKFSIPTPNVKKFKHGIQDLSFPKMAMPSFAMPRVSSRIAKLGRNRSGVGSSARLVLLVAPIAAVLVLLYLLTTIILSSPQSFSGYFGFATQSSKSYPVPGVGVKELGLKVVKLDNGEDLQLLTGEFYNNSGKSVQNPVIEGVLFDTKGEILARSFHTLDKDLSEVQYESLDRKTLTELPNSKEKDKFVLLPNQKQSFAFALSVDSEVQPTYFAGRVYSIS